MGDKEEETQNSNLQPLDTSQISSNMSRYEDIKVSILKIHEYPIWKVRMAMCLEATYLEYLNIIYDGPHRPMKVAILLVGERKKMIDKDGKDYSPEDISSIMKDAKVRHIMHSSLDSVMSNRGIGCKITKEIWDALEVKCQGTTATKKNRRTVLTQEYEHFDSRDNESLTEIYERL